MLICRRIKRRNVKFTEVRVYNMNPNLKGFIKFLVDQGLVEFDIVGNGEKQFINRLKLQKYVFLAKRFGMPFNYRHGIYLYGPYSRKLAADYYALARDSGENDRTPAAIPDGFRKDDFMKSIRNDPNWLEIATTLIGMNERIKGRTALIDRVCHIKHGFSEKFITGVLNDLEARALVSISV